MRQRGDYLTKKMRRNSVMTEGMKRQQVTVMNQSYQRKQIKVTNRAPNVNAPWIMVKWVCLTLSLYCSAIRDEVIPRTESDPSPQSANPRAAIQIVLENITTKQPTQLIAHAQTATFFLPQLSAKKDTKIYPNKAPKQGKVVQRLMSTQSLQRQFPNSLARDLNFLESALINYGHCYLFNAQTQSQQLSVRSPWDQQSNEELRKIKAVLSRMIPVANQAMLYMNVEII